jgi:DNA replication and repair protein RecF
MLRIQSISLTQFKNYSSRDFLFNKRIVGICGNNGAGKTNLLDSIYYLCFAKSYFSRAETVNVQQGQSGFRLVGGFVLNEKDENAVCILRETGKKELSVNDNLYEKLSGHIGRYTCVMIAPDDAQLITGGSEERRRFLDLLLSQLDAEYLKQLIVYNKILRQRNSLLASFVETGNRNMPLLDVLNEQLTKPGNYIFTNDSVL